MSELAGPLLALEKGMKIGAVGFKEARELFRGTWQRAFPEYDVEKVFFRCVYTTGGLFAAWATYQVFFQLRFITKKPVKWFLELAALPFKFGVPFIFGALHALFPKKAEEAEEAYAKRLEEERIKLLNDLGIPVWLDDIFGKHFFWVLLAANGLWVFSEYRAYKKLKKLSMKILKD